jgi:hypothetical protein
MKNTNAPNGQPISAVLTTMWMERLSQKRRS